MKVVAFYTISNLKLKSFQNCKPYIFDIGEKSCCSLSEKFFEDITEKFKRFKICMILRGKKDYIGYTIIFYVADSALNFNNKCLNRI